MSSIRKLFRPGAGQVHQAFTAAFAEESIYPNDVVALSHTAPTSQGSSGVLEGKTLGLGDYIYVVLADTDDTGGVGCQLGVAVGKGINSVSDRTSVLGDVVAADNLLHIQTWGVTRLVQTDDTVAAGAVLTLSTSAGICADATTSLLENHVGVALLADEAYARAAATDDTAGCRAFIRCAM